MLLACLDLEGVLLPEIWINVAEKTKIKELKLTTRDISDYDELMQHRLKILKENDITIKLIQTNEKEAELIVKDTGEGIQPENISKIFDPLFTTKPFGEATGLGLSIVQEFVNQFKGSISVTSKPGLTKFTVIMPKAR